MKLSNNKKDKKELLITQSDEYQILWFIHRITEGYSLTLTYSVIEYPFYHRIFNIILQSSFVLNILYYEFTLIMLKF